MLYIAQIAQFSPEPKFLLVLALVALVLLLVLSGGGGKRRGSSAAAAPKRCPACGADHPGFARFCRQCGKKLPE